MLHNIYLFRCLTIKQVYRSFYENKFNTLNKFMDTKLNELLKYEIIEEVVFNKTNVALFLTKLGVELIKNVFDLPNEIFDIKRKKIIRGYYRASELKMLPRLIPHQVFLNQFVLDFEKIYTHKNIKSPWKYFDEKYVSKYTNIRPDGLINFLDTDLFLEMDMGTETKSQLIDKWKHYRAFLSTSEYNNNNNKIIVFFILENTSNLESRKNLVKYTASQILLDSFDSNFDIIVGSRVEILKRLFNVIIPDIQQTNYKLECLKEIISNKHHFKVANGLNLKNKLNNAHYELYIRKIDEDNKVMVEKGKVQEYLLDYYYGDNLSIINKIAYLSKNSSSFKRYFNREIYYIVVVDDLSLLYKDLSLFDLVLEKSVFYTTIERLDTLPFYKALCQFDNFGRLYSFIDSGLYMRSYD